MTTLPDIDQLMKDQERSRFNQPACHHSWRPSTLSQTNHSIANKDCGCSNKLGNINGYNIRNPQTIQDRPFLVMSQHRPISVDCENHLFNYGRYLQPRPVREIGLLDHQFNYLPETGCPQQVDRIIEPPVELGGWIRGGKLTR